MNSTSSAESITSSEVAACADTCTVVFLPSAVTLTELTRGSWLPGSTVYFVRDSESTSDSPAASSAPALTGIVPIRLSTTKMLTSVTMPELITVIR